jgi:predicted transcriptional regulator
VIADVHAALKLVCHEVTATSSADEPQKPAISIDDSIHEDKLTCLECGEKFTSIKRHLMSAHGLSPAEYRKKWKLGDDYPMISPTYSSTRSTLAKGMGLGAKVGKAR